MLTCRQFIEFLMDYLSRNLPMAAHAQFEYHLSDCPECMAYLREYQTTIDLSKMPFSALDSPVPPEVPEELIAAILNARGHKA
ncbi:MAG: anti-sigma factor [Candidatus Binatia bacterium]